MHHRQHHHLGALLGLSEGIIGLQALFGRSLCSWGTLGTGLATPVAPWLLFGRSRLQSGLHKKSARAVLCRLRRPQMDQEEAASLRAAMLTETAQM